VTVAWVDTVLQGLLLGGLYALFATGLSLIFGVMRIVNLAHGDLSILAAFLAVVLVEALGLNPLWALLVVVPLLAALGYLLQALVLNRLLGRGILPPILVTFGLSIIIQNVLLETFSADSRRLNPGGIETASIALGGDLAVGWFPLITLAVAVLILAGLQVVIGRLPVGRAFRATSDDQETAELMGIDNRRLYALAMALSLAIVAVAGVFLGIRTTFTFSSGPDRLLFAFEAVIIGGLGSLWGTLVGGAVLGVAQTMGAKLSPGWGILGGHLVFLAVLLFRPQGLFARARRVD
jgi:branched-chain amino acid transport system permease protein